MPKPLKTQVMTANRLGDGRVVYLGNEDWTTDLADARLLPDADTQALAEEVAKAAVADRAIVEPYLIDVDEEAERIEPVRLRERIRASGGPTTGSSVAA